MVNSERKQEFEKQQYRVVGNHSVVKVCSWTKQCLRGRGTCYKNTFYGIQTWRCVEMSPTWLCNHSCQFCWRDTTSSCGVEWQGRVDEPKEIVDGCVREWRDLLYGFGGSETVDKQKYSEVDKPLHFAISLTGEPTLYPKLPELIKEIHSRGMTSFLVSNGTIPGMLQKLLDEGEQPTQLYISLISPDKQTYETVARPLLKNSWEKIMETMQLLKKFNRSVVRITAVKDLNMQNAKGYAQIINKAQPDFIEIKGYMNIGHAMKRLKVENMPTHSEIKDFSEKLSKLTGYHYTDEREESRVVLLVKDLNKELKIKF